jgi:tetratricopeptide (TPR) repeat protein
MITTRHMTLEAELIRWVLLIVAAIALVLAVATLAAADPMMEPQLLPGDMDEIARPIPVDSARPYFPETPPAREFPPAEAAARVWTILEHHRAGRALEAIVGWEQLRLPYETAHWREVAMGAAYLQAGDLKQALAHLEAARQTAPEHAVVAYYMGLVRLEQAAAATLVPDGMNFGRARLVAYTPQEDKAVYELLALAELRRATTEAADVRLDERLMATEMAMEEVIVIPRVGDLLAALGATNFAGKAHHMLFGLHLDRGELIEAELNLDMAAATGMATLYGYRDLAEVYLAVGREVDGARAVRKELRLNHPWVGEACERLAEMTHTAARAVWVW